MNSKEQNTNWYSFDDENFVKPGTFRKIEQSKTKTKTFRQCVNEPTIFFHQIA